jgi:hypothetical protein
LAVLGIAEALYFEINEAGARDQVRVSREFPQGDRLVKGVSPGR